MRLASTKTAAVLCGGLLLAMSIPASAAVDAKLLDMLKANGSITNAQYSELQAELARDQKDQQIARQAQQETNEQIAATAKKTDTLSAFDQKLAWAAKTQFKGDVRFREETVHNDGVPNNKDQDRQRIRARLGAYSEINPQVDTGIRIATGSNDDARSTNQDLNNYFDKKQIWLDQGYVDYHPDAIKNLHLVGGKMPQQWVSMGDIIWDSDISPEGLSASYKYPLSGSTELFGSAGHYTLKDNVDGEGVQFKHDLRLYAGQLGARFAITDSMKMTLGGSIYSYDNDSNSACPTTGTATAPCALAVNGNSPGETFKLYEGFGQLDFTNLPVPLSLYGQYVNNKDASNDQDTGWLAGVKTKLYGFAVDYNYRDVQQNSVVGAFTDSDFANGYTGSRGSKLKVSYELDKNFNLGATYFMANSDYTNASIKKTDSDINTLQLDAEAKF
ncbi:MULTISPECIES: putative porin [Pseudomonas]|uniref:putative porin n=1 Tax=Pseudomonas TaxID=286 RepID=UPI0004857894|nr:MULTISPECIES: putative porin [Pseudomonas]MBF6038492.1 putative porin [Pseudomonas mucoides]